MSEEYSSDDKVISSFKNISKLIENLKGVDVNKEVFVEFNGRECSTFLEWAVFSNNYAAAKILLISGANPNITFGKNKTLCMMKKACEKENIAMVTLLLAYGIDMNPEGNRLSDCIFSCYVDKNYEILNLFSRYGVDVEEEIRKLNYRSKVKEKFIKDFHLYNSLCSKIKRVK